MKSALVFSFWLNPFEELKKRLEKSTLDHLVNSLMGHLARKRERMKL